MRLLDTFFPYIDINNNPDSVDNRYRKREAGGVGDSGGDGGGKRPLGACKVAASQPGARSLLMDEMVCSPIYEQESCSSTSFY